MHLAHYLGLLERAERTLADAFDEVRAAHGDEPDVAHECTLLAGWCRHHAEQLAPFGQRYGEEAADEPERLHSELFGGSRTGPMALLRDLHDLYLMATECDIAWTLVGQGARGARDDALVEVVSTCEGETTRQLAWLRTRMSQAAPQVLVVAS